MPVGLPTVSRRGSGDVGRTVGRGGPEYSEVHLLVRRVSARSVPVAALFCRALLCSAGSSHLHLHEPRSWRSPASSSLLSETGAEAGEQGNRGDRG